MVNFRKWLVPAALFVSVAPTCAAEPEVAFVVTDGWVLLTLTQDDQPVPDAQVKVFDSRGQVFANGETGVKGLGQFPLPPGASFRVEIKIGDRAADPIHLTPIDGHVVPTNVLLSFGLAPCCKPPQRAVRASQEDLPGPAHVWHHAAGSLAFVILGLAILIIYRSRAPKEKL